MSEGTSMATDQGAAAPPVAVKSKKEINQERLQNLKDAKERAKNEKAAAAAQPGTGEAKPARVRKAKAEKVVKPCRCGCGGQTTAFFVPGHDARFKGWMLSVEKGTKEIKDLPASVQKEYKFTKRGKGYVPDKNYKGEPYVPYLSEEDVKE